MIKASERRFPVRLVFPLPQFCRFGIAEDVAAIGTTIDRALTEAGVSGEAVDHVFLTGGTSFVPAVRRLFTDRFGAGKVTAGGEFVSVAEGLALIGRDRER